MPIQAIDECWCVKVDSEAWSKVLHLGIKHAFTQGDCIVNAGEQVTQLRYLHSGTVCMKRTSLDGNEKIIMQVEQNALFCEVPFFTGEAICSSFVCHTDATVYSFARKTVDAMLRDYPFIAKDIIRTLSLKVSVLSNQLASLGLDTLEQRLVKFILVRYNAASLSSNEIISLGALRMKDIASIMGVHRATLYKALKALEKMNLIKVLHKNRLHILDIDGLAAIAYH